MSELTRYWITLDYPPLESEGIVIGTGWWQPFGFGVTAIDVDDAMSIVRREWFERIDREMPPIREIVEDVDISTLDEHVIPNMNPPNWRGLWFPRTGPLR